MCAIMAEQIIFYCPYEECSKSYTTRDGLDVHIRTYHEGVRLKCCVCEQPFTQKPSLNRHLKNVHKVNIDAKEKNPGLDPKPSTDTSREVYICSCKKEMEDIDILILHVQNNHPEWNSHITPVKRRMTDDPEEKIRKRGRPRKLGPPKEPRTYPCKFCERVFTQKDGLIVHERTHTGEKPYKCDQCDYASGVEPNRNRHQRKRTLGVLYPCHSCDFKFCLQQTLNKHYIQCHGAIAPKTLSQSKTNDSNENGTPDSDIAVQSVIKGPAITREPVRNLPRLLFTPKSSRLREGTPVLRYTTQRVCHRCEKTHKSKFDLEIHLKGCPVKVHK